MSTLKNHIYFASDFHLGVPDYASSLKREKMLIQWLEKIKGSASEIYLMGDLFDFWFEYKRVAPKGFVRILGKLAELSDSGIKISLFTGNHDMWMFDYLEQELNIFIYRAPIERTFSSKTFYLAHGDGMGPGDHGYKFVKKLFSNKFCQWLFARLHPNFAFGVANYFSGKSRIANEQSDKKFLGNENEWLVQYSQEMLKVKHFDYFIFGHRHLPLDIELSANSRYINLGDWVHYFTYAEFDGETTTLKTFIPEPIPIV